MKAKPHTTNLVSKQGGQWQVLEWNEEDQEWTQVGPYLATESEAEAFILKIERLAFARSLQQTFN